MKILTYIGVGIGVVFVVFIVYLIVVGLIMGIYGGAQCKAMGYRESTLGFPTTIYCVKRIDQTDHVVPLKELKKLKQ